MKTHKYAVNQHLLQILLSWVRSRFFIPTSILLIRTSLRSVQEGWQLPIEGKELRNEGCKERPVLKKLR